MEAILLFLIKTVGSGVIGHYLKKQLESIDGRLPALFEAGNRKEIEEYVQSVGLQQQISALAADTLNNSFVIPSIPAGAATVADRVELFKNVLDFGFAYSRKIKCDVLLPGSLLGADSLTLFEGNENGVPTLRKNELRITIKERHETENNTLYFIPCASEREKGEIMKNYKSYLLDKREETFGYVAYRARMVLRDADICTVGAVSPRSCYFLLSHAVKERFPNYFTAVRGYPPKLVNWVAGVEEMLAWAPTLDDLGSITQEEIGEILEAYNRLKSLY